MSEPGRVVILGAGPGGMSAALWCASLGLEVTVLERAARAGGQLHGIAHRIENLPGLPGASGPALAGVLATQLATGAVDLRLEHAAALDATALRVRCDARRLTLDAAAVVVATGVRRRTLGVPGEQAFTGRGVEYNLGARGAEYRGQRVLVVGGGDDAFEHARLLAPYARTVTVVHRSDRYAARAALAEPLGVLPNVALRPFCRVEAVEGREGVEAVRLRTLTGSERVPCDAVFVCVGPVPQASALGLATNAAGYVRVDRLQRTSRAGVWAIGDVCCPEAPTIATAIGQGAVVAKAICATLAGTALAVGTPPGGSDRLRIEGITLPARIGVYPRERRRTQTLTFAIDFAVDAAGAAPADSLAQTIDYAAVASTLAQVLGAKHYNLIETVAEVVAAALLERFASRRVRVRVTKPGVPQRHASASIEVERSR